MRLILTPFAHALYYRTFPNSFSQFLQFISEQNKMSFPDGHAGFLFVIAFSVYLVDHNWGTFFLISVLILNIYRIVAGIHSFIDITVGAFIGAMTAFLVYRLFERKKIKA